MKLWREASDRDLRNIRAIVTDLDGTLTDASGRVASLTYASLWAARDAGLRVIVATGRSVGWADLLVRQWPLDGVIAEGGGVALTLRADGIIERRYARAERQRAADSTALYRAASEVLHQFPRARLAADQAFRETDLAIDHSEEVRPPLSQKVREAITAHFIKSGFSASASSIHVNAHAGSYDKSGLSKKVLASLGVSVKAALYVGDAPNDEGAFAAFSHSVGVANIAPHLPHLKHRPTFATEGAGGAGFVEVVDRLRAARSRGR